MESRCDGADDLPMASAAHTLDTGVSSQQIKSADALLQWPYCSETRDHAAYHVRPIQADDARRDRRFLEGLNASSSVSGPPHDPAAELLNRLVRTNYRREMALVAVASDSAAEPVVGVARYGGNPAFCELAIAVADEWQSRGIGSTLAQLLFAHAKSQGVRRLYCLIAANNIRMLKLAARLQMTLRRSGEDDAIVEAWRTL
jgi:acetyltransferase